MDGTSPEALRDALLEQVADFRRNLRDGYADLSGLEEGVRAYCEAVAGLPREEGRLHVQGLQELVREISVLGDALTAAQEDVRRELSGLGLARKANVAYKQSDAMGTVYPFPEDEE